MTFEQRPLELQHRFPERYFCRWDDDDGAIVWPHGVTIAFREEVLAAAERVKERLKWAPPAGALALILAACRDNWGESPSKSGIVTGFFVSVGEKDGNVTRLVEQVFQNLDVIHQAWKRCRKQRDIKAELAAAVFARLVSYGDAPLNVPFPVRWPDARERALAEIRTLNAALHHVALDGLCALLETGIEQAHDLAPAPVVELPLPETGSPRDLIRSLEDDLELSGVARLARRLLAAIELPLSLTDPDDLQQGGVSDIANRGPLDRLLLSELAHDDLTLAVRVAMREALYLRRETPPRPPARRRVVLVDAGLRTWGVPRVFAASVALALAAADQRKPSTSQLAGLRVETYRSAGEDAELVDFSTREGLLAHLAALDDGLHPGAALKGLLNRLGRSLLPEGTSNAFPTSTDHRPGQTAAGPFRQKEPTNPDEPIAEVVVVADEDALADSMFQQAVAALDLPRVYLAAVNREGDFLLSERTAHGRKVIRRARFDLDEILAPRQPEKKLRAPPLKVADRGDLPAIFHVDEFPLLLPQAIAEQRMGRVENFGVVQFTRDGRLLKWFSREHGAIQLAEDVPGARLHWLSPTPPRPGPGGLTLAMVTGKLGRDGLIGVTYLDIEGVASRPLVHGIEHPLGVTGRGTIALVFDRQHIAAVDLMSGELLARQTFPEPCHWRSTWLFQSVQHTSQYGHHWYAAGFDGRELQLIRVPDVTRDALLVTTLPAATLSRRDGFACLTHSDGHLSLTSQGEVVHRWQRMPLTDPKSVAGVRVAAVSRDGLRVALHVRQKTPPTVLHGYEREWTVVLDLTTGQMNPCRGLPQDAVESPALDMIRPRTMRHRFEAVAATKTELILISRDAQRWSIQLADKATSLGLSKQPLKPPFPSATPVPFQPLDAAARTQYDLRVARFADGSRVFLDGRGLLHLASSDGRVPEFTLVLADGETAGWAASGASWKFGVRWGSPYFHPPESTFAAVGDAAKDCFFPFLEHLRCS